MASFICSAVYRDQPRVEVAAAAGEISLNLEYLAKRREGGERR